MNGQPTTCPDLTTSDAASAESPFGAVLLTIGDELNRGEIIDTNAAFFGTELTSLGVPVHQRVGCNDRLEDIAQAVRQAALVGNLLIVSGGLGPTSDDLTVDAVACVLGVEPVIEPDHETRMRKLFDDRGLGLTANNLRQVRIPSGAQVLANRTGLAPGFSVMLAKTRGFFLPGVPREMKPMFLEQVVPRIRQTLPKQATLRKVYRTLGLGESHVDHRLADLLAKCVPAHVRVSIHYRLAFPEVLVTLLLSGAEQDHVEQVAGQLDEEVHKRLGSAIYGTGDDDLAQLICSTLVARGATLAVAESCTGGMIGQALTSVPGSSAYFLGGVIAYGNQVKQSVLGVQEQTLQKHGAVSEACVRQMAEGVRQCIGATYGIAVSGIAGPGGGTIEKPVGTVWLAVAGPTETVSKLVVRPGDREQIRKIATAATLHVLLKMLRSSPDGSSGLPQSHS